MEFFRVLSGPESGLEARREKARHTVRAGHGALQASPRHHSFLDGGPGRPRREGTEDPKFFVRIEGLEPEETMVLAGASQLATRRDDRRGSARDDPRPRSPARVAAQRTR